LGYSLILAVDIYSEAGVLIVPAGTRIDHKLQELIVGHGKGIVSILQEDAPPDVSFSSIAPESVKEFTEFRQNYELKEKEIESALESIRTGESIDVEKTYEITNSMISSLKTKSDVFLYMDFMKSYDNHTFSHSNNVSMLANVFGQWLELPNDDLVNLTTGGLMHDIGKTEIPHEIICKPGKLTPEEFTIIKNHPKLGYELLKDQDIHEGIKQCAYAHHEKMDGSGYPRSLKKDDIHFYAKIIAICDIYDAMTSRRVYRDKICPFDVIHQLEIGMYGELDTELLLVFLKKIAENYVHGWVVLSNNMEAQVVFINQNNVSRPLVQTADNKFIDLSEHPDINILKLR
jgi:putative nucleotidyltransferase with HDIG domain